MISNFKNFIGYLKRVKSYGRKFVVPKAPKVVVRIWLVSIEKKWKMSGHIDRQEKPNIHKKLDNFGPTIGRKRYQKSQFITSNP
jgi:hypothetical protein